MNSVIGVMLARFEYAIRNEGRPFWAQCKDWGKAFVSVFFFMCEIQFQNMKFLKEKDGCPRMKNFKNWKNFWVYKKLKKEKKEKKVNT